MIDIATHVYIINKHNVVVNTITGLRKRKGKSCAQELKEKTGGIW